jgi:hypothetical protein
MLRGCNAQQRARWEKPQEDIMRKLILAAASVAAFATAALAVPGPSTSVRSAADELSLTQVQFRFGGHRHCWYARGWNGPGWYWCGYHHRRGYGWGGPEGWNGWHRR